MTTPFLIRFEHGRTATGVRLDGPTDIPAGVAALGLHGSRPVIVLVGGAGGLDDRDAERLRTLFADGLVSTAVRCGAAAIDGGTLSGVMRLLGEAHHAAAAGTPLVGVAAAGTVAVPGDPPPDTEAAPLEPHHTHFVLVPGDEWGAEAVWIADVAAAVAGGMPSVTVLVNGGEIAYDDVERSTAAGRPVITLAGSGRTADQLAAALRGDEADPRARSLAATGLVHAAPVDDPAGVSRTLAAVLESDTT
jgi:SLOG in TRPM, prokaryote